MKLPTETFGNVIVVHTPEDLSADQAEDLLDFLVTLPHHNLVLDIDHTEALDSAGLTALLDAQDRLLELGGDAKIATSSATNRKIMEITRLDRQLEVFESVIDAVKNFR